MRFDDRHEVVVTGPWTQEMVQAVESGVADRVVLNYALGYDEPDLHFLEYLPIRELVVLDRRITDLRPVYTLAPKLELLHLTVDPGVQVDLTELPNLHDLSAGWAQVEATVAAASHLRRVALGAYKPADLTPLTGLRNLSVISMKDRPKLRSLAGLSELVLLTDLGVYAASGLEDISELRGRDLLESLYLQSCPKLGRLDDLAGCTGLVKLNIAEGAELESARPLGGLERLEELYAYDTTKFADGDLSPIAQLPRLTELRMQNRRHYRPSVTEIKAEIAGRAAG